MGTTPKPSIVHGTADQPLLDFTLAELLDFQTRTHGDRECLVFPWNGTRWTYRRLQEESIALAKAMLAHGIGPGDRVAIMAGNCEQYAAIFFAVMRVGGVLVILNNTYTYMEALNALRFTEPKMLFTTARIGHTDNSSLLQHLAHETDAVDVRILYGEPGPFATYAELLEGSIADMELELQAVRGLFNTHDVCNLQFTSGTTGSPKAAMLTHYSLVNNSRFIGSRMSLTPDDVLCCPPPMFHCFGLVLGMLSVINHGAKIVYPSESFDAQACLNAISQEACTALHGVPAMFDSIFAQPRPVGFQSRLRTGIIAGAPVPKHLMELMVNELGMTEFTSSYGLTEASPTCFNAFVNTSINTKLSTVGTVMPHAHAKIVDREGKIVPMGTRGELCMAGYQLQRGYYRNPVKTAETMDRDEAGVLWLHTGDEAVFHPDGTCTITGRFKDIIIRGGENIYPLEIEDRLIQHPEITRAIVVGVGHVRLGEVVTAFLERAEKSGQALTTAEVQAWVRGRLGHHKAPVHVFWLGEGNVPLDVPLTGSGKVKKHEMKALAERLLEPARARL